MAEKEIGKITHYFGNVGVGIIDLKDALKVGEKLHIVGHAYDFIQDVTSMQIEHKDVREARAGDCVGIRVPQKVHEQDKVFKVT